MKTRAKMTADVEHVAGSLSEKRGGGGGGGGGTH